MKQIRTISLSLVMLAFTSCASSHILVGTERESIDSDDVKIYLQPPAKYEAVALLEASDLGANGFSAQSRMNKVIGRLKDEAADLGANGVLIQGIDTQVVGSIGSGFANTSVVGNSAFTTGTGYTAAQVSKVGKAIAIYVPEGTEAGQNNGATMTAATSAVPQTAAFANVPSSAENPHGESSEVKTLYKCPQADGTSVYSSIAKEGCVVMGKYAD